MILAVYIYDTSLIHEKFNAYSGMSRGNIKGPNKYCQILFNGKILYSYIFFPIGIGNDLSRLLVSWLLKLAIPTMSLQ